ncbi:polysaccharide deacetylase family protein [Synechococcus sp. W60.2]|uniref:polysaccharide deacetylase family protein n=1 Tax=Synechococcus sp. W60.2 TaxID=2964521 RepID=UPI0039C0C0D0
MTSRQPPTRRGGHPVPRAKRGSPFLGRSLSSSAQRPPTQLRFRLLRFLALLTTVLGFGTGALVAWATAHPGWVSRLSGLLPPPAELPAPRAEAKAARQRPPLPQQPQLQRDPFALDPLASLSYVPAIMYHDVVAGRKEVWFDTTAAELRQHFEAIKQAGLIPIHIDQLYKHLRDGDPLPEKAILLTFDDAYLGLYENAYPLLKEYNYPATYFVQTGFVGVPTSKDHFTWDQMREMDASGLIDFAAHTVNHPPDLRVLDDARLRREVFDCKTKLEEELGHPIHYFAYPEGNRDERVKQYLAEAGYWMAFTMDPGFTGQSPNLLEVRRFNQFRITEAIIGARTFTLSRSLDYWLDVTQPLAPTDEVIDGVRILTIRGGRAATVHAERRYEVRTLAQRYQADAGINGSFFSIPWINSASNVMVGPVMAANHKTFIPGRPEDDQAIRGRPLVLLGRDRLRFVPFDPDTMTHLENIRQLMPDVTDLFVAGLWLVKDGHALSPAEINSFRLASAAEFRPRAFFGVDDQERVVIGVTKTHVNAAILASLLPKTGIREAVLLDSGFSTSLVYQGEILATGHAGPNQPSRPVPHAILLYDMNRLWARDPLPEAKAGSEGDRLEGLVQLLPASDQDAAKAQLESVLASQRTLRRGDRGAAVVAVQLGLSHLATQQGRLDLLPSGPDGVYGQELAQAMAELVLAAPERSEMGSPLPATPTPLVAGTATARQGVDIIDAQLLRRLLERVNLASPSVLVDTRLERPALSLERKPERKLLPSASVQPHTGAPSPTSGLSR